MGNGRKKGPYGCKCQTLAHKLVGDGCDECQPMSDAPERVTASEALEAIEKGERYNGNPEPFQTIRRYVRQTKDEIARKDEAFAGVDGMFMVCREKLRLAEAENARLREKLSAFEGALTAEVARTEAMRRIVHEIGAEGLMAENARLREAMDRLSVAAYEIHLRAHEELTEADDE